MPAPRRFCLLMCALSPAAVAPSLAAAPCTPVAAQGTFLLDADTPTTGSDLDISPLVTPFGTVTYVGEIRPTSDPEFAAAGSVGDVFDIDAPNSDAILTFDFDVTAVTFIYGGNTGSISVEARDVNGMIVDSFFQASTNANEPAGPETLSGGGIRSVYWTDPGFNFCALDNIMIQVGSGGVGTTYCSPAVVNSTGAPGTISASGSVNAGDNNLTLMGAALPPSSFAFFLTSTVQGNIGQPGGSQGVLCLGGAIGRYIGPGQIQQANASGAIALQIDLTQHPQPTGFVSVMAGETWNFQAWYRDAVGGMATSNFTDGLEVGFL